MDILRFLLRIPFVLLRAFSWLLIRLLQLCALLLRPFVGNINWQAPVWAGKVRQGFHWAEQWVSRHPLRVSSALVLLAAVTGAAFYGYHWYLNRPRPIEPAPIVYQRATVEVQAPAQFDYRKTNAPIPALHLEFSRPAAPLTAINKVVSQGISLSPAIDGKWEWRGESTLTFTPTKPWPMGQEYRIQLDAKTLLAPQTTLTEPPKSALRFTTPPFEAQLSQAEFYQDPQNPQQKKAIFHIKFTAPVDVTHFEKLISLQLIQGKEGRKTPQQHSIVYDENKLEAWVHSAPLMPLPEGGTIQLLLGKGVQSTQPGNPTSNQQTAEVAVPQLYSLKVQSVEATLVESDEKPGEHVRTLIIATSDAVPEQALQQATQAWLLPQHNASDPHSSKEATDFYHWVKEPIDNAVLAQAQKLTLTLNEGEQENQSLSSFQFDAPSLRFVLVEINNTLTSAGGYQLPKKFYKVIRVPDYPKMVRFMSEGALLSLNGTQQLSVTTRNLPGMQLDIRRVIPSQLQHIVSFKGGSFGNYNHYSFSYPARSEHFTEHFSSQTVLDNSDPGKTSYQELDLSPYLSADPAARRGIFLLTLSPWDPQSKARSTDDNTEDAADYDYHAERELRNVSDSRLVVITDLGVIAKYTRDGGHDVFVQSIHSGQPVTGAKVSVVAINGVPLLQRTTESDGHVRFPSLAAFKNEREPLMFLVEKEGDVSYLPLYHYDRELNFSRFDVGGDYIPKDPRTLNSYLFSDRGVYRPGDTFNIGLITRTADWSQTLSGIPLSAKITDPRGTLMNTVPIQLDSSGFNELSYTTGENSPTGEWTVSLYLKDKNNRNDTLLGYTLVNVKEFEPDQLKVKLQLTPDRQQGWVKPQELHASIEVQNLFGTPAQKRRIASKLILRPAYPRFDQFPDYQFYEKQRERDSFESELTDQETDEQGHATLPLDLSAYADATYQLQLLSEAFEAGGGRSVTATARTLVSPHDVLVGSKADGDLGYINRHASRNLHLIAVAPDLQLRSLPALQLALIEKKYISVLTKQESGVYKYQSKLKEEQVETHPLEISAQGTDIALNTTQPGNYVLLVKDADGNILNQIEYSVAGNANVTRSLDRNAELNLKLNKQEYRPGEEIEIAINAPYTGSGLITIELEKVYALQWFQTDTTSSVQKIRLPEGLEGNGYINVQFVRDINSDEIFMSPLSYGVVPFRISLDNRRAGLQLTSPERLKPGETLPITVTTDSPQRVVVFAIDEGILQVARYRLPDPLLHFFSKKALSVDTSQILDLILPESSKLMKLVAAAGGDSGEGLDLHLNPFKRKRDKPVAYWSGLTEVNGSHTFNYPLPDYFNGKIRVMAISVTPTHIGRAQSASTVRDDLILTPNVPAMVAPGDEFDVSVGVANNLEGEPNTPTDVQVTLTPPPQLEVVGESAQHITLKEQQEGMLTFRLRAKSALGDAPLAFHARYGEKSSQRIISTSVRPAMPFRTQSVMGRMSGSSQQVDNLRQMFDAYARRQALVSHSPLVLSSGLAQYLADYPHYCSEQLVSRSIPLILQSKHPEMKSSLSQVEAREQLQNILTVLRSRQNGQGAIGQWRSSVDPDPFITPYTVQYLLEAQAAGYPVSAEMLQEANTALRQWAANNSNDDLYHLRLRAFSVYLLTRQGEVTTNLLATVQERLQARYPQEWQQDLSALYLAAAYRLLKMDDEAHKLLQPTWAQLKTAYNKAWWTQNYFDPLVQNAVRLYLITRHFPEKAQEIPPQLLENMVQALREERYTTHSSAMSILALESYSSLMAERYRGTDTLQIKALSAEPGAQPQVISQLQGLFAQGVFGASAKELQFTNQADAPAWYVVTQAGYDLQAPKQAISRGLEITREYRDEAGKPVQQITLGQKINVHLSIRSNSQEYLDNLAIIDLLPGGFEVVQQAPPEPETGDESEAGNTAPAWLSPLTVAGSTWKPNYSDIREDRVIIYGSADQQVKTFVYQIKATNTGTFLIPPAFGEAMYDREIQALSVSDGSLVVVAPAGEE